MKKIFSVFIAVIMLFSFAAGAEDIIDDMYQDDGYMEDDHIEDEYIEDEFVPDNMYSEDELHNGNYVDYDNNNSFGYIEEVTANSTSSKVIIDGKEVQFEAYNIDYNNYFKLRDIGVIMDFEVDWDEGNNCILINTNNSYAQ